jgi:4-amino-4-deoxy-L-arabinose transferase-like glycosyltransferase
VKEQALSVTKERRWLLGLILGVYLFLGALFASFTPPWQAPDEPAHFNYIRTVAATGRLPVLQAGDYDEAFLNEIKAARFPDGMSIDAIRYEGHQPPLYYWLAAPILWATGGLELKGQVIALRWFGVLIGAGVVALVWAAVRRLFPRQMWRAHLAAGFSAFLPMHLAMMASINNDGLSELLIAAAMFRLLGHLKHATLPAKTWAVTGLIVGLGLLTKFQAYILLPLAGVVWLWAAVGSRKRTWMMTAALAWLIPALALPLAWWLRNMAVYGPADPFGLVRHNAVVSGQPRTADWILAHGWPGYLDRLSEFTFKSFWGVFGWLGVFLDQRLYTLLALLSLLLVFGLAVWFWRREAMEAWQRRGLALLGLQVALVVAAFAWYNVDFVQHQGRYLFPALLPLSLAFALGLEGLSTDEGSRWVAIVAAALTVIVALAGLIGGDIDGWATLATLGAAGLLAINGWIRRAPLAAWGVAAPALLVLMAVYALFGAIVPQLAGLN